MISTALKIDPIQNQPSDDSVLYRYVTIDKLLDFLFCGRIPLIRLNTFEDKLEGVNVDHLLLNYASESIGRSTEKWIGDLSKYIALNVFHNKKNSLTRLREVFQDTNYASCWYKNNHESVAMWQLYSNLDSVAIRIPYKAFSKDILDHNFDLPSSNFVKLKFGCVRYYRYNDIYEIGNIANRKDLQGFTKEYSFQHEQEFRIILQAQQTERKKLERKEFILDKQIIRTNEMINTKVIYMTFTNFKSLPFEIIFHPKACTWHQENIIKIIQKFEIPFKYYESTLKDVFI